MALKFFYTFQLFENGNKCDYFSLNILWPIKLEGMKWTGNLSCKGQKPEGQTLRERSWCGWK